VEGWNLEQRPEGTVVGLFGQSCMVPRAAPVAETRAQRLSRPRQSQRWAKVFKFAGRPPEGSQWIYIADRESDFYEPIQTCQQQMIDYIIRGYQDRCLAEGKGHVREALAQAPVLGQTTVEVRARGSQPARTAMVEIRSVRIDLKGPWRPGGWQPDLKGVNVGEVREVHAREGVKEPLPWILLTSLRCPTSAQAQRVAGPHGARRSVADYHTALTSGA